jgi:hypothetical protein
MTAEQAVAQYSDAWRTRRGDMSDCAAAQDVRFVGPVASFETAEAQQAILRGLQQAVEGDRAA